MKIPMLLQNKRILFSFERVVLTISLLSLGNLLIAQDYEWELDKAKQRQEAQRRLNDSLMLKLEGNWQFSLAYGRFLFNRSAIHATEADLSFPRNIDLWNLSMARYLSESVSIHVNLGLHLNRIEPPNPDFLLILQGENVEIEGGGILLLPVSVGMDYFFLKKRFRPYVGGSLGLVSARFRYIEASGNINSGIKRNEYSLSSYAPSIELSSGFVYRSGKNIQMGVEASYVHSSRFSELTGTYAAYKGWGISTLIALLL